MSVLNVFKNLFSKPAAKPVQAKEAPARKVTKASGTKKAAPKKKTQK